MSEIDNTARAYFDAIAHSGEAPLVIVGGLLDGLSYFPREIDGTEYLVSEIGLLTPAEVEQQQGRLSKEPPRP